MLALLFPLEFPYYYWLVENNNKQLKIVFIYRSTLGKLNKCNSISITAQTVVVK